MTRQQKWKWDDSKDSSPHENPAERGLQLRLPKRRIRFLVKDSRVMYGGSRENWCDNDIHASENESGYVHVCVYVEDDHLPKCQELGQRLQQKFRRILFLTLASILKPVKMRHNQFLAQSNANASRRLMIIPNIDSVLPNENASKREKKAQQSSSMSR